MALATTFEEAPVVQPRVSLGDVYNKIKKGLFGASEDVLMSLGEFQKQLQLHITEIKTLTGEIERQNHEFAVKMYECGRALTRVSDYFRLIISSTKTLVDYGCDQKAIPGIRLLIEEKRYLEAEQDLKRFLSFLQKLIKRVRGNIEKLEQNCPNLDTMKSKVEEERASALSATNPIKQKADDIPQSRYKIFKLGISACCYTAVGAVTGVMIASQATLDESQISKALMSFGSEALLFQTGNVIKGLKSMMEALNLSDNLQKSIQDRIAAVNKCLTGFFKLVIQFQEGITSIEVAINGLDTNIIDLQDEDVDCQAGSPDDFAWILKSKILQEMFAGFTHLGVIVTEKQKLIDEDVIEEAMAQFDRATQLVSRGTPV